MLSNVLAFTAGGITSSCGTNEVRKSNGAMAHSDESNNTDNDP